MRNGIVLITFIIIAACTEKSDHKSSDNIKPTQNFYCFINRIVEKNSGYYINVDFIEVLTGDSAVEAAKKIGQAEFEVSETGDTNWFVPNDYFILNTEIDSSLVQVDKDCQIVIYASDETTNYQITEKRNLSPESLRSHIERNKIFEIQVSESKVIVIREFWTP